MNQQLGGLGRIMMTQQDTEWQQSILNAMRLRVDTAIQYPEMIPTHAGGWWHQYVCPVHELPLVFELTSPQLHQCPRGCVHMGERFDAAYRVFAHRFYASLARDAAVLYQATNDECYFEASSRILSRYAELYANFDAGKDSQAWMLTGKAFQQALTEAIWAVPLAQAFKIIRPKLPASHADLLTDHLLRPIVDLLSRAHKKLVFKQDRLKSNYTAWLIAALGCLGFALGDEGLIEQAIMGPGGFKDHLNAAILPEGFEYEGTPYYHNFVTLAYTLLAEIASEHGMDLYAIQGKQGQTIEKMWSVLAELMWSDGSFPLLHDGNYWQNSSFDTELCEVYEIAFARTADPRYGWLLRNAYRRHDHQRDSWAALKVASQNIAAFPQPIQRSALINDIGVGILRDIADPDGLAALLRFGSYGGGHTHLDCLGLLINPFSIDAGNPPYGVDSRRSWYQQSAAHNVVIIDGLSQAPADGRLVSWTSERGRTVVDATANQVYPGVNFCRRVTLGHGQLKDRVSLSAKEVHVFDWLLHTDVPAACENLEFKPCEGNLFTEGPASLIQLESESVETAILKVTFEQNGQKFSLVLISDNLMKIFRARSPRRGGVDMGMRYTLVARVYNLQTEFIAIYGKI